LILLKGIKRVRVKNRFYFGLLFLLFFLCWLFLINLVTRSPAAAQQGSQEEFRISGEQFLKNFYMIPAGALEEISRDDEIFLQQTFLAGGLIFTSLAFDLKIREYFQGEIYRGSIPLSRFLYNIGTFEYAVPVFAALYASTRLVEDTYLENTLLYSAQSLILTSVFTEIVKNIVRRERPRNSPEDPLVRGEGGSFFSGHASAAWAVLTSVAVSYPKLKIPAYSLAGAVSLARIYEDAHWFSDVLAGSLAGYAIARLTGLFYPLESSNITIKPLVETSAVGLSIAGEF